MTWLFAFTALGVVALLAFAHVGLRAAAGFASRDCGGRLHEDCSGCGALNGQRCFVSEPAVATPRKPPKYPRFIPAKRGWFGTTPAELRLPDGTVLLNEHEPGDPLHYCLEWYDRQTGERASKDVVERANSEIEARNERALAIKRSRRFARKYGGAR